MSFHESILYSILLQGVKGSPQAVLSDYSRIFGQPDAGDDWESGISSRRWVDRTTVLRVDFQTGWQSEGAPEVDIFYLDSEVMARIPMQEVR